MYGVGFLGGFTQQNPLGFLGMHSDVSTLNSNERYFDAV